MGNISIGAVTVAAGATDQGLRRSHNEDAFLIDPDLGLLVLADGMGGHLAGEVASQEAIAVVRQHLNDGSAPASAVDEATLTSLDAIMAEDDASPASVEATRRLLERVLAAVLSANQRVHGINQERGLAAGQSMGTTITGLICTPNDTACNVAFHVGDSRLYRFRNGEFAQLSRDHSMFQDWLEQGRIGAEPKKNILTQAVGPRPQINPSVFAPSFRPGDLFLLCSDGLSDLVDDAWLAQCLGAADADHLDKTCDALIDEANRRGGRDNITVILCTRTA